VVRGELELSQRGLADEKSKRFAGSARGSGTEDADAAGPVGTLDGRA